MGAAARYTKSATENQRRRQNEGSKRPKKDRGQAGDEQARLKGGEGG